MSVKTKSMGAGRPGAGATRRTVELGGRSIAVRSAVAPLIELLLENVGETMTLDTLGKRLGLKPMTVRYYMVDARITFNAAGYTLDTVTGQGVCLRVSE